MAKKRAGAAKQRSIVVLKGSVEWAEWFGRLVEHSRMPGAVLIDRALLEWAGRNGFDEKPPKR